MAIGGCELDFVVHTHLRARIHTVGLVPRSAYPNPYVIAPVAYLFVC